MYPTKGRGMRLWRYQGANALGQDPRTLFCRSRYRKVKKGYKKSENFGDSEKARIFAMLKKTMNIIINH